MVYRENILEITLQRSQKMMPEAEIYVLTAKMESFGFSGTAGGLYCRILSGKIIGDAVSAALFPVRQAESRQPLPVCIS